MCLKAPQGRPTSRVVMALPTLGDLRKLHQQGEISKKSSG